MVNNFAIGLTHLLLAIAAWRLVARRDLDHDIGPEEAGSANGEQTRPRGRTAADG